jgi:tryptophanyl-tRNA synthetase
MDPQSFNASSSGPRILSGIQPSGRLHLGNYYGALHQFIQLQREGEALYFIANLHALSTLRDGQSLLPVARVPEYAAVVAGTDGQKMSKSARNTIDLFATDAEVRRQVMGIRTDSTPLELPKPTDNALYQLLALLAPHGEFSELDKSWKAGGKGYAEYKKALLEYFHATFDTARRRREELRQDPAEVERILVDGAHRAREIAAPIMAQIRLATGIR